MAGLFHGAGEEAAIEQVQDRVLDAADILIDRHPRIDHRHVGRRGLDPRIGEALEIPRQVDEGVHGIGLAPRRPAALRAGDVLPGRMMIERIARPVEADVVGQGHRQIFFRHRHHAAFGAMDDRDRTAPITLPRNAPIAQPVIHLALRHRTVAGALFLQPSRDFLLRFRNRHAVQKPRIDHAAVAVVGRVGDDEGFRIDVRRADHRHIAKSVFVDEIEVALVVRRAAENGAGAVVHQDEVGDIDRDLPRRIERMQGLDAGVEAELFGGVDLGLRGAAMPALLDEFGQRRILRRRRRGQRMVRRQRHEFGAEQRVRPRGENFELALAVRRGFLIEREADQQAFRAADPVLLHQPHFFRPAVERIQRGEQACEYLVILNTHWLISRCSTSAPERQPRPSITCSLASTV